MKNRKVYCDERYILGMDDNYPYLKINDKKYVLTCHPYEPCLYITDENGSKTAVHNAFDPFYVLEAFHSGKTVTSITGVEYDARDFCRMVEYAAGMLDINIDGAESVFSGRAKKKNSEPEKRKKEKESREEALFSPEAERSIVDDPFYSVIDEYPDCVVEFCLVKSGHIANSRDAHRDALVQACRKLFFDGAEQIWRCDCGVAEGRQAETALLFADAAEERGVNYRGAFRFPPCGVRYSDKDFDRVNAALFPSGTDGLEVYRWTTDWSDYFDEGGEWWGALCLTVYDKMLDRFVVIMASATD